MDATRRSTTPFSLRCKQFKTLFRSIVKVFPEEEMDYYYEPSFVQHTQNKDPVKRLKVNAKGELLKAYDAYRNKIMKKVGLIIKKSNPTTSRTASESLQKRGLNEIDLSILNKDDLSPEDESVAFRVWKDVYDYRNETAFPLKSAFEMMNNFKILRTNFAPDLIRFDFEKKFGSEVSRRLLSSASKIAKQIISMLASDLNISMLYENTEINTAEIHTQIVKFTNQRDILTKNLKIYNDSHRDCIAVSLIPTLIHYNVGQSKGINWKVTASERVHSFLESIQSHDELDSLVQKNASSTADYNSRVDFIVICGPFQRSSCYHVVVDDVIFDFVNVVAALDVCYKLFHVLRLDYTHACSQSWSIIQKIMYQMKDRKLVQSNKIAALTSKVNKIVVD